MIPPGRRSLPTLAQCPGHGHQPGPPPGHSKRSLVCLCLRPPWHLHALPAWGPDLGSRNKGSRGTRLPSGLLPLSVLSLLSLWGGRVLPASGLTGPPLQLGRVPWPPLHEGAWWRGDEAAAWLSRPRPSSPSPCAAPGGRGSPAVRSAGAAPSSERG